MQFLKQSTASQIISLGQFVDDNDGKTAETALTITNTDIKLKKAGATAVNKNSGGATHDASGFYHATLDATDTNTVGHLRVFVAVSGALTVWEDFTVVEEAVYDALFGSSAVGPLLANAAPTNFGDLAITATTGQVTVGTNNDKTGYTASTVSDKTGYSISGTKTTLDALNDVSAADVNAQCDTALTDYDAPTKAEMDSAFTEIKGATWATTDTLEQIHDDLAVVDTEVGDIQTDLTDAMGATFSTATDSLEAIRDRGDAAWTTGAGGSAPTVGEIADAVWDETLADHLGAGSTGSGLNSASSAGDPWNTALPGAYSAGSAGKILGDNLNATVSSRATQTSVDTIDTEVGDILTDTGTTGVVIAAAQTVATVTDVTNEVSADVTKISGNSTVADNLEASLETMLVGTATGGTTTSVTSALTGYGDDTFKGRIMLMRTGTLQFEAAAITAYDSTTGTFTFAADAWTTDPTIETFVIV